MKRIKKHIKRMHKIKVHDNRWLAWAVAFIFIAMMSLVFYIKITDHLFVSQMSSGSHVINKGVVYKDPYLGFTLQHPLNWGIEAQVRNVVNFNEPLDLSSGMSVGLYDEDDEASIRRSIDIDRETDVTVNGRPAKLIIAEDGEKIVLVKNDGRLYVIRGNTIWFEGVVNTVTFIPVQR